MTYFEKNYVKHFYIRGSVPEPQIIAYLSYIPEFYHSPPNIKKSEKFAFFSNFPNNFSNFY